MSIEPIYGPSKFVDKKYDALVRKYPHLHQPLANRPFIGRRQFFQIVGAGVTGSYLAGKLPAADTLSSAGAVTKNTAKNVIFILLTGAISPWDTFDLKQIPNTTPASFNPTSINGIDWPVGLLPKLGQQLSNMAIVRSMSAHALVHTLAQTWSQIGRNPAAALGNIAPNIGSVVAIEKASQRTPSQILPGFIALNSPAGVGEGYLPATYAPFRVGETAAVSNGVANTTNQFGQARFGTMSARLHQLDDVLRISSPYGDSLNDYNDFYAQANGLMYNPQVQKAFAYTAADSLRYGATGANGNTVATAFGNACLVAKQILASNLGTRFIQISFGSWDMHQNIYGAQGNSLFTMGPQLDGGVGTLLADLESSGLLAETLVVMLGEFGRTPGGLTGNGGRDHFLLQSAMFAGAGVTGGRVIGATNATGSAVTDFGWNGSGNTGPRYVWPEDVEATIYSAVGIDWTKIRPDDPFRRGFEYVPFGSQGTYGPINELWS